MYRSFKGSWDLGHPGARVFGIGFDKGCGPGEGRGRSREFNFQFGDEFAFGGTFGTRRPLRFLAHKLGLDDDQIRRLAQILDTLKTERAQEAVDSRRTLSSFADAVAGESFDEVKAASGAGLRVEGAERLRKATLEALRSIHAVLRPEQREQLEYLIRTGRLVI
jgi:Spy/CpxP family protein refolding chaperone